jgi:hypothetical protein
MKKPKKRGGGKGGTKRAKDLSPRARSVVGGSSKYTMFMPDGTPIRATPVSPTQLTMPGKVEFPN